MWAILGDVGGFSSGQATCVRWVFVEGPIPPAYHEPGLEGGIMQMEDCFAEFERLVANFAALRAQADAALKTSRPACGTHAHSR
jgi:hypothetical protein